MLVNSVAYKDGRKIADVPREQIHDYLRRGDCIVWVAVRDPEPHELDRLEEEFDLPPLAIEDARHGHQRPKFEEYGDSLFFVLHMIEPDGDDLRVDTWLMSCRVIARTAEHFAFADLLTFARGQGARRLVGDYLPTRKNPQVAGLYADLGLDPAGPTPGEPAGQRFTADPAALPLPRTFVRPA